MSSSPVCGTAVKPNGLATHVELTVDGLRTGVRFPPPPPTNKKPTLAVGFLLVADGWGLIPGRVADGGLARGFVDSNCFESAPGERAFDAANALGQIPPRRASVRTVGRSFLALLGRTFFGAQARLNSD